MAARPLLRLPPPDAVGVPGGHFGGARIRFPGRGRQREKFGPLFERLRTVLSTQGRLDVRDDPTSLAPERVIVFEVAGTIADFRKAVARIDGLEFMAESEGEFAADEDFALEDSRRGREGQDRTDQGVPGRLYLALPNLRALNELRSLWERWERGLPMDRGFTPFAHLFEQLRTLRPWGPEDRVSPETLAYWNDELQRNPNQPVRTEVELWFRDTERRRRSVSQDFVARVLAVGGQLVHEAIISDIAYHGALIDIPAVEVENLIEHGAVNLALADEIMFLRPQGMLLGPIEVEAGPDGMDVPAEALPSAASPVAACSTACRCRHMRFSQTDYFSMIRTIFRPRQSFRAAFTARRWLRLSCMETAMREDQRFRGGFMSVR